ncbi:MAG: T9SS type A sorting domain-containing protein [Cyclobacteriaceae bacterium]
MKNNKWIILAFFLISSLTVLGQSEDDNIVSAENVVFAETIEASNKLELYPNPAVDYLIIQINNSTLVDAEFELHSIIGNEIAIQTEDLGGGRYRIPVKNLSTGYYFVVIKDESSRYKKARKFLKN